MRPSSIFSFDTLQLGRRDVASLGCVMIGAMLVVAGVEGLLRLDPYPAALPAETTRTGTLLALVAEREPAPDVIFLGSSICAWGVAPHAFEARWRESTGTACRAFNLGINGGAVADLEPLYRRVLRPRPPKRIVIVIAPHELQDGPSKAATSYAIDALSGALPAPEAALMTLHLFRYRRQYRSLRYQAYLLTSRSLRADLERRAGPHLKGWFPAKGRFAHHRSRVTALRVHSPDMARLDVVSRTLALAAEDNVEAVLVIPPLPSTYDAMLAQPAAVWPAFRRALADIARRHGVPLIDFPRPGAYPDTCFIDHVHLTEAEALRFSAELAQAIATAR